MIDITGVNMIELVKKVYDLSRPQGLGFMHFNPEPMTDEQARDYINDDGTVNMDYVSGRACKFHVRKEDDQYVIGDSWYDHDNDQLIALLAHVGITVDKDNLSEHSCSCNCDPCRAKQGKVVLPESGYVEEEAGIKIVPVDGEL